LIVRALDARSRAFFFFFFAEPEPVEWRPLAKISVTFGDRDALPSIGSELSAARLNRRGAADKVRRQLGNEYIKFLGERLSSQYTFPIAFMRGSAQAGSSVFGNIQLVVDVGAFLSRALIISEIAYRGAKTANELRVFFEKTPAARRAAWQLFSTISAAVQSLTQKFAEERLLLITKFTIRAAGAHRLSRRSILGLKGASSDDGTTTSSSNKEFNNSQSSPAKPS